MNVNGSSTKAAASVRHPNVASVFHLGKSAGKYFYAMEFVEGETLEKLMKRSGRLEIKLALEIAAQVAAGLAAVHKQKLVHRDIKPSNLMVSLGEEALGSLHKPVCCSPAALSALKAGSFGLCRLGHRDNGSGFRPTPERHIFRRVTWLNSFRGDSRMRIKNLMD